MKITWQKVDKMYVFVARLASMDCPLTVAEEKISAYCEKHFPGSSMIPSCMYDFVLVYRDLISASSGFAFYLMAYGCNTSTT